VTVALAAAPTPDVGGAATTTEFATTVIEHLAAVRA
jgi:hypothetical protein